MNRPVRSRNICLAITAAGVCSLAAAFAASTPIPFFIVGLLAALVGGVLTVSNHAEVRSLRRLERGEDIAARWTLPTNEWEEFAAQSRAWDKQEGAWPNSLDVEQKAPPAGMEIVAGWHSIRVGAEFMELYQLCTAFHSVTWLHTQPAVIEVTGRYQTKNGSYPRALRIPVSAASQKAAMDLHAAWNYRLLLQNAGSGTFRNPVRARNICLAIGAVGLVSLSIPLPLTGRSLTELLMSNLYGPMLAFGFIAAMLGGLIGLMLHVRSGKQYRAFLRAGGVRWRVDPARWQAFTDFDRARSMQLDVAFNFLSRPQTVPSGGVLFVANEQGLMVGDELFLFSVIATGDRIQARWIDTPLLCLELWGVFQTKGTSGSFTLRFPVDPAARETLGILTAKW